MKPKMLCSAIMQAILTGGIALILMGSYPAAAQEGVLYNFQGSYNYGPDGAFPESNLIFDAKGNLYGTTGYGGTNGAGSVFELSPQSGGGWSEAVLYSFQNNGEDGNSPSAGLIFDSAGNLYGTTVGGGNNGVGTVFELSPHSGGAWSEAVLYNFQNNGQDGINPYASLIFDSVGNLYGTTSGGGTGNCVAEGGNPGCGIIFEISPQSGGGWSETVLLNFQGTPTDGYAPFGGLIFDNAGNLYGTTIAGGSIGSGTVFELSPQSGGGWSETILYSFLSNGRDGNGPNASVIFDGTGNLYGTTATGGTGCGGGCGTIFELSPKSGGVWVEKVLHSFQYSDGAFPEGSLIIDSASNLYGTTEYGGSGRGAECDGCGTVFELLSASVSSASTFQILRVLHSFQDDGQDGVNPAAGLIADAGGDLYGTTIQGGSGGCNSQFGVGCGTVFEVSHSARNGDQWPGKPVGTANR